MQYYTYLSYESEVVADQNHPSLKFVDGAGESVDGLHVQMVGWLVQQEEVWPAERQPGKDDPTSLPIGEIPNWTNLAENDMMPSSHTTTREIDFHSFWAVEGFYCERM